MDVTPISPKVAAAALGSSAATVIMVILQWATGAQPPPGLEGAIASLTAGLLGFLVRDSLRRAVPPGAGPGPGDPPPPGPPSP